MNELVNNISNFTNVDFGNVRVWTDENGKAWFFGVDVCKALGYAKHEDAIHRNVDHRDIRVYVRGHTPTTIKGGGGSLIVSGRERRTGNSV